MTDVKPKNRKVYKSNKLNKAGFSDYTLNDYRVYLNAIALLGSADQQGKYLQPDPLARQYKLSAKEFSSQFNIELKHAYGILKAAMDKLRKTDIKIEKPDMFTTTYINVCEKVEYNHKEGTIDILFTGSIMDYLKQRTKNFTLYNLKEVADLASIYAVRLYELVQQFNTTTGMIIHTLEQWRDIFGLAQEQYKQYGHLKDKVFNQAMDEINSKTGYKLVMTEEKEGRKVVRVRFDFEPDTVQSGLDKRTGKMTTRHRKAKKQTITPNTKAPETDPNQLELAI
jgi:plasmid replication initiation protein